MSTTSVTWEQSGKPRLMDPRFPHTELSISHDGDLGVAVVGHGPQGCDLQAVESRSRADWDALLGAGRAAHLDDLIAGGDTLDQAGTRLWTVVESSIKALGGPASQDIRTIGRTGGAVLHEVDHPEHGAWRIFTSAISLELGHDHILATGLEREPRTIMTSVDRLEPAVEPPMEPATEPAAPHSYVQPFTVLVRDVPKVLGAAHYPSFISWMSASREGALRAIVDRVERDLRQDKGKMVSSSLSLRCLAPAKVGDRIVTVLTTTSRDWQHGPYTFEWAFRLGNEDGPVIATGTMDSVWIAPNSDGVYTVAAPPDYLRDFMTSLADPRTVPNVTERALGETLALASGASVLAETHCDITVTLDETDFQGHAHFVNYFRWQAIARDTLLNAIGLPIATGPFVPECVSAEMQFLREVMPFERIRVHAEVEAVYTDGLDLRFSFRRLDASGNPDQKVAFGRHRLAITTLVGGELVPCPLPSDVLAMAGARSPELMAA